MRRFFLFALLTCVAWPLLAQQYDNAKDILDKTADAFRRAGGVKAEFVLKTVTNGRLEGAGSGTILLKGEKFVLHASDIITWFDGKTQWSYVVNNEEVNVSNPTSEELQQLNPYSFLYLYQKGFNYRLGTVKSFHGKKVWEVILSAKDKTQELASIVLYVTKGTYEPLYIQLQRRGEQTRNEITVTQYATHQTYPDALFVFDNKKFPQAEIIDLR